MRRCSQILFFGILINCNFSHPGGIKIKHDGTVKPITKKSAKALQKYLRGHEKGHLSCKPRNSSPNVTPMSKTQTYESFVREYEAGGGSAIYPVRDSHYYRFGTLCHTGCSEHQNLMVNIYKKDFQLCFAADQYYLGFKVNQASKNNFSGLPQFEHQSAEMNAQFTRCPDYLETEEPVFWKEFTKFFRDYGINYLADGRQDKFDNEALLTSKFIQIMIYPQFQLLLLDINNEIGCMRQAIKQDNPSGISDRISSDIKENSQGEPYLFHPVNVGDIMFNLGRNGFFPRNLEELTEAYVSNIRKMNAFATLFPVSLLNWDVRVTSIRQICGFNLFSKISSDITKMLKDKNLEEKTYVQNWNVMDTSIWYDLLNDWGFFFNVTDETRECSESKNAEIASRYKEELHTHNTKYLKFQDWYFDFRFDAENDISELYPIYRMTDTHSDELFELECKPFGISGKALIFCKDYIDLLKNPDKAAESSKELRKIIFNTLQRNSGDITMVNSKRKCPIRKVPKSDPGENARGEPTGQLQKPSANRSMKTETPPTVTAVANSTTPQSPKPRTPDINIRSSTVSIISNNTNDATTEIMTNSKSTSYSDDNFKSLHTPSAPPSSPEEVNGTSSAASIPPNTGVQRMNGNQSVNNSTAKKSVHDIETWDSKDTSKSLGGWSRRPSSQGKLDGSDNNKANQHESDSRMNHQNSTDHSGDLHFSDLAIPVFICHMTVPTAVIFLICSKKRSRQNTRK